jgi:predicted Holliday junction resolvase-like endonuclease
VIVVVLLMLLFCLLLPLMALLYFDILTIQKKAERTETRIEKLLKSLEEKDKK